MNRTGIVATRFAPQHVGRHNDIEDYRTHHDGSGSMSNVVFPEPHSAASTKILPLPIQKGAASGPPPRPRTSFVGREREVALVQSLLCRDDVSLVTLRGPGGVGKTRIATHVAVSTPHTVHFVDLAELHQPEHMLPAIASALGITPDARPIIDGLSFALRDGDHVLVLDNFEQILAAASALAQLLDACPCVKMLVTSRVMLGLSGEHIVDVPPFALPKPDSRLSVEALADLDAVRLFVERVQALHPQFVLTDANAEIIVEIGRRLDGLPLAIELAAAWIPVLSPSEVLARLERRLALPDAGSVDRPGRHRTLRDTIAWSHDLLDAPAQVLFRRLAVCIGGCTLAAIEDICGEDGVLPLHALHGLIAHSLVQRIETSCGESRFTMLETVREFGVERLEQRGEANLIRQRYAEHFLALAERAEAMLNSDERDIWLDRLEADQGNLQSVFDWALEREDAELALRLAGALWPFWRFRFLAGAGLDWFRRALAITTEVSPPVLRKALFGAGSLAWAQGHYGQAEALLADALAASQETDALAARGHVELALGRLAWDQGDQHVARHRFEEANRLFGQVDDRMGLAYGLHGMGLVAQKDGDHQLSTSYFQDALASWQSLGFSWGLACCIPGHLADVARAEGRLTEAITFYQECLSLNWSQRDYENVSWCFIGLAVILATDGQVERAARMLGSVDQVQDRIDAPLMPDVGQDYDDATRRCEAAVGAERLAELRAAGAATDLAEGVAEALALARSEAPSKADSAASFGLTSREREVLRLLAAGRSNRQIADALFISPGTAKLHVGRILAKLGVPSRSAATDFAHRHGLI